MTTDEAILTAIGALSEQITVVQKRDYQKADYEKMLEREDREIDELEKAITLLDAMLEPENQMDWSEGETDWEKEYENLEF